MPKIPDIQQMSPDRWLSQMQQVRQELLADFTGVLDAESAPESAAEALTAVFDDYGWQGEAGDHKAMLDVRTDEDELVFWHESGEQEVRLTHDGSSWKRPESADASHHDLATTALQLIPWWTDGAFAAKVGTPEQFADDDPADE